MWAILRRTNSITFNSLALIAASSWRAIHEVLRWRASPHKQVTVLYIERNLKDRILTLNQVMVSISAAFASSTINREPSTPGKARFYKSLQYVCLIILTHILDLTDMLRSLSYANWNYGDTNFRWIRLWFLTSSSTLTF